MPHPRPTEGHRNLSVERFEEALLWKIDELKVERGMNRSSMMQHLVWLGLQHMGFTKAAVREEYAERSGQR